MIVNYLSIKKKNKHGAGDGRGEEKSVASEWFLKARHNMCRCIYHVYNLSGHLGDTGTIVTVLAMCNTNKRIFTWWHSPEELLLLVPSMECFLHWRWQLGICKTFKAAANTLTATVASLCPSAGHQEQFMPICGGVINREVSLVSTSLDGPIHGFKEP